MEFILLFFLGLMIYGGGRYETKKAAITEKRICLEGKCYKVEELHE